MKTKMLAGLQICIIVLLKHLLKIFDAIGYLYFPPAGPLLDPRPRPPAQAPNLYLLALAYDLYAHGMLSWFTLNDAE